MSRIAGGVSDLRALRTSAFVRMSIPPKQATADAPPPPSLSIRLALRPAGHTWWTRASEPTRPTSDLTGKPLLTYIEHMVGTPDREQDVFGAISHPARRRMLDLLVEADRSVNTIAGHFQMSRPAVSQHLRVLLDVGLVTEQRRGRERRYHLVPKRLGPVRDWIAHYEQFWDDRLQRLRKLLTKGNKE
jgi:DNA-binding transcriptional ArsR family regulator